ncbi:hypothetical protein RRX38_16510 [Pseudomonas sp. DTU_2021_1001937_2_SI_NGA_ILE_001]|uniref:hypothetical protein n=1 Tax=Pseudomonas sp. DTU_2021_1001937_2_SI_NGA_ILE_001 TaxID=3077589 RepID=UPI0028FC129C|nr:hypothetical protein [Pseudomonas sp. DTU_2021_1001937_2_SI_NGA_ILE_001]WNW12681.1 hypothetical protein RRX38_16510 [Pseudomonas sp. DTU_2021_1001937_2_SI_NGA_ILE_001]
MNSLRIAQLRISPRRVQQGLIASLVLLLTLLSVQQVQFREQVREAAALQQALISRTLPTAAAATLATPAKGEAKARNLTPVDELVSQDSPVPVLPAQQRWIF